MSGRASWALTLAAVLITACGGSAPEGNAGGPPAAGQAIVVSTSPAEADVAPGGTVVFGAQVTGTADDSVVWQVVEPDGGTIDWTGLYIAPATEGTYHVRAVSTASTKSNGTSVVRVKKSATGQVLVAIHPAAATVPAGGTQAFAAAVTGTTTTTVTWTVQGTNCGAVSATGVYTAPNSGATCTVTATSVADGSKKATATVTVTAPPVTIAINPTTATLDACLGQQFTATVGNTSNTGVTWTITESGGGTVTSGAYVSPPTAGTYHVVAVSQADPTRTATATITVGPEKVLSIAVTPGSATLQANGTLSLSALVTTTCGTFAAQ